MCRHLAYLGPPAALSSLLFDASHALCAQSRTPRHQPPGRTNPDGWGVVWYPDGAVAPEQYRSKTSIWSDEAFTLGTERATAVVAAARLASPGTTLDVRNNAPFVSSRWSFSLNGFGFHNEREATLRAALSPERRGALEGDTDTEVLFGLVLDRLDRGVDPASALGEVTALVDPDDDVRLNMLLGDGTSVVGTAWGNSLFILSRDDCFLVASEPLDDDPAWVPVPDRSVVDGSHLIPLGGSP
jgi:glutamine amidotransferase